MRLLVTKVGQVMASMFPLKRGDNVHVPTEPYRVKGITHRHLSCLCSTVSANKNSNRDSPHQQYFSANTGSLIVVIKTTVVYPDHLKIQNSLSLRIEHVGI